MQSDNTSTYQFTLESQLPESVMHKRIYSFVILRLLFYTFSEKKNVCLWQKILLKQVKN